MHVAHQDWLAVGRRACLEAFGLYFLPISELLQVARSFGRRVGGRRHLELVLTRHTIDSSDFNRLLLRNIEAIAETSDYNRHIVERISDQLAQLREAQTRLSEMVDQLSPVRSDQKESQHRLTETLIRDRTLLRSPLDIFETHLAAVKRRPLLRRSTMSFAWSRFEEQAEEALRSGLLPGRFASAHDMLVLNRPPDLDAIIFLVVILEQEQLFEFPLPALERFLQTYARGDIPAARRALMAAVLAAERHG